MKKAVQSLLFLCFIFAASPCYAQYRLRPYTFGEALGAMGSLFHFFMLIVCILGPFYAVARGVYGLVKYGERLKADPLARKKARRAVIAVLWVVAGICLLASIVALFCSREIAIPHRRRALSPQPEATFGGIDPRLRRPSTQPEATFGGIDPRLRRP